MTLSLKFFGRAKTEVADPVDSGETAAPRKIFKGPMAVVAGIALATSGYLALGQMMGHVNTETLPDVTLSEGQSHLVDTMGRVLQREYKTGWAPSARINPLWTRVDQKAFQHGVHDFMKLLSQRMPSMFTLSGNNDSGIRTLNGAQTDLGRDFDICSYWTSDDTGDRVGEAAHKYAKFNADRANLGRHSLEPRIDTAGEFVNALIPQYRDLTDWVQAVVDSHTESSDVRTAYYYMQGYLYATHEATKAFREDFLPVLDRQASMSVIDKLIIDSGRSLAYNPLPVFNGTGFGFLPGNLQAILGVANAVHADLKALQDALAAGASRSGYDAPKAPLVNPATATGHAAPATGLGTKK